jgi:hypothetical protein
MKSRKQQITRFRRTRKRLGGQGSKEETKSKSKSHSKSESESKSKSKSKSKSHSKSESPPVFLQGDLAKEFVEENTKEKSSGLPIEDTVSYINELLPSFGEDFSSLQNKDAKTMSKFMNMLSFWTEKINASDRIFHVKFPFSHMTMGVPSRKNVMTKTKAKNPENAKERIVLCTYELYAFRRQMRYYITNDSANVCDELKKYIPYYSLSDKPVNEYKQKIFCVILLIIGYVNRILQISNTCALLLKGGKSIQFFTEFKSYDIDIAIVPNKSEDRVASGLSDEEIVNIGEMVTELMFWVIPDANAKMLYMQNKDSRASHIFKFRFKDEPAIIIPTSESILSKLTAEEKQEIDESVKQWENASSLREEPKLKILDKEGKEFSSVRSSFPRLKVNEDLVYDSFLDIGCGYNYAPGYIKYLYSMYKSETLENSPYFFSYQSLVSIVQEKLYILVYYLQYFGYNLFAYNTDTKMAKANNFFRDKTYRSLIKLLPLLEKEKISLLACLNGIVKGHKTAYISGLIPKNDPLQDQSYLLIVDRLFEINALGLTTSYDIETNKRILQIITFEIYEKVFQIKESKTLLNLARLSLLPLNTEYRDIRSNGIKYTKLSHMAKEFGTRFLAIKPLSNKAKKDETKDPTVEYIPVLNEKYAFKI